MRDENPEKCKQRQGQEAQLNHSQGAPTLKVGVVTGGISFRDVCFRQNILSHWWDDEYQKKTSQEANEVGKRRDDWGGGRGVPG